MSQAGGCRCGAVRYTLDGGELPRSYACHCRHCQSASGSAFALQGPMSAASVAVAGSLAIWARRSANGADSEWFVCATCYTTIYSTNSRRPGRIILRMGTLDRSDELVPLAHIWTARKQPWLALPDDTAAYPQNAPADVMQTLFITR